MFDGFKKFILRGNVVDLSVGVVIGAAFGGVVSALVKDLITPLIAAIVTAPDFSELHFMINGSKFLYGDFINALVSFVIVAITVYFFVVTPVNALVARTSREAPLDPAIKKCPECFSQIPLQATRCAHCTTMLE